MAFRFRIGLIHAAWSILLAYLWLVSYFGADFSQSMWSVPERGIGLVVMTACWLIFLILSQPSVHRFLRPLLSVSFGVSVLFGIAACIEVIRFAGERPQGPFGNAAFLASYLLLHVFIGLHLARGPMQRPWRIVIISSSALIALAVILTGTRGAAFGLFAGLFIMNVMDFSLTKRRMALIAAIALLAASGAFFLSRNAPFWHSVPVFGHFSGTIAALSGGRTVAWAAAGDAIRAQPFFGWGFETFDYAFNAAYRASFSSISGAEDYLSKPHNIFLEYAVAGGIPGLLLFLAFLAISFLAAFRAGIPVSERPALLGFLAAYAASQFFLFDSWGSMLPLVLVLAFIASRSPSRALPLIACRFMVAFAAIFFIFLGISFSAIWRSERSVARAVRFLRAGDMSASFDAWDAAFAAGGPYHVSVLRRYAAALQDAAAQGIPVPDAALRTERAMAGLAGAIALHPHNYFYRMAYADAAPAFSRYDTDYLARGEEYVSAAIAENPHRSEARYILAKIYLKQGAAARALAVMAEAVTADPESGDAHFFLGLIMLAAGRNEEGFGEIARAADLGRLTHGAAESKILADRYGDAGRYDAALREYGRALSNDPDNADILFNRALVLDYGGDRDAARDAFSSIGARFPGFRHTPRYEAATPVLRLLGAPTAP